MIVETFKASKTDPNKYGSRLEGVIVLDRVDPPSSEDESTPTAPPPPPEPEQKPVAAKRTPAWVNKGKTT